MARKKSSAEPKAEEQASPAEAPFTTASYGDVKKLHSAGILAVNSYGQPMVFEYALEDRKRIEEVLAQ